MKFHRFHRKQGGERVTNEGVANMNILELFSGTKSFSALAEERGHRTFTVDIDPKYDPDLVADIEFLKVYEIPKRHYHFIWISPDCSTFSVAGFQAHKRNTNHQSEKANKADRTIQHAIELVDMLEPEYFIFENPMGLLRKMPYMQRFRRYFVTYCQYGFDRMKPTDLFGRLPSAFVPKSCKNGDRCHVRSPRGSRTGTQGRHLEEKFKVPRALCEDILIKVEDAILTQERAP